MLCPLCRCPMGMLSMAAEVSSAAALPSILHYYFYVPSILHVYHPTLALRISALLPISVNLERQGAGIGRGLLATAGSHVLSPVQASFSALEHCAI